MRNLIQYLVNWNRNRKQRMTTRPTVFVYNLADGINTQIMMANLENEMLLEEYVNETKTELRA